jgi:hypothetical protein
VTSALTPPSLTLQDLLDGCAQQRKVIPIEVALHLVEGILGVLADRHPEPVYVAPHLVRVGLDGMVWLAPSTRRASRKRSLFAAGAILFQLLTLEASIASPAPLLVRPDVPLALKAVVARALVLDRARRFRSPETFLRALAAIPRERRGALRWLDAHLDHLLEMETTETRSFPVLSAQVVAVRAVDPRSTTEITAAQVPAFGEEHHTEPLGGFVGLSGL